MDDVEGLRVETRLGIKQVEELLWCRQWAGCTGRVLGVSERLGGSGFMVTVVVVAAAAERRTPDEIATRVS